MTRKTPIAGIILAAGMSTRFGRPKQLTRFNGKPLIGRVLDASLNSRLHSLILVLGYKHQAILEAIDRNRRNPRLRIIVNPAYREGQSSSLRAGLLAAKDTFASVMFLVADQPMLDANTINLLLDRFLKSEKDICVPVFQGRRGNPTLFSSRMYGRLLSIRGDTGARSIIDTHPDCVLSVEINTPLALFDIDTPEDLSAL